MKVKSNEQTTERGSVGPDEVCTQEPIVVTPVPKVNRKKFKRRKKSPGQKADLNLPRSYPWKVLSAFVDDLMEFLTEDEYALLSQIIRDRDFDAYSLLSQEWGLQAYQVPTGNSKSPFKTYKHISVIRAKYAISALLKKFRFNTDKDMRESAAIKKFYMAEDVCRSYNHSGYQALSWGETEKDAQVFTYARSFLRKVLGGSSPSKEIMTSWSRHGPGSNLDTLKGQSSSFYKFGNWPYSCTTKAVPYARFLISTDKRWLGYLENSYRKRFNVPKHMILDQEVFWDNVIKVVKGNRITFVPKNALTERSIAIEPSMNLMLQLGVDGYIRRRLKRWDIDLDSQTKNQVLAYRGSINPTDESYVTLDMSMASDSISLKLCELLLPQEWYSYLCKIRSPQGQIGKDVISYEKISSMGNGFTFALESAIFAALVYGAVKTHSGDFDFKTDMSIFGDDIIVRKNMCAKVIRSLENAGFQLNAEKSFTDGPARESCGSDWIQGSPVRPVFFDDIPSDVLELFTDVNRLKRLLKLRWGIEKSKTFDLMTKWIPEKFRNIIGPVSDDEFDSYIHSNLPKGSYANCVWEYPRLIREPVEVANVNSFLNRKMMHDLRGKSESFERQFSRRKKISAGGSRFTVYKSYSYTVSRTFSSSGFWMSNYAEVDPLVLS